MTLEKMIGNLITGRQNDSVINKHYTKEHNTDWDYEAVEEVYDKLQTALTRILIDHHYCRNEGCVCSAEYDIKKLIDEQGEILEEELYGNEYAFLMENWGNGHVND